MATWLRHIPNHCHYGVAPLIMQVWDVRSRKLLVDLPGHADEVFAVDWSPDGSSVASGGKDKVLKLWRH
jgi:ribosome assembly protein 4